MTKQEQKEWNELYQYIKKDILKYDDKMILPRWFVLRLKGLKDGKFCANKKTKSLGEYSFYIILLTFKINKFNIINSINNNKFKDEKHKINYIMAIIENNINDTCQRLNKLKKAEQKCEDMDVFINNNKANYNKKTKSVTNSRLKGLL